MSCAQICFIQLQRSNLGARCSSCTCKQALGKVRHEFSRSVLWEQFYDPLKRGGNHTPPALKIQKNLAFFPTYWLRAESSRVSNPGSGKTFHSSRNRLWNPSLGSFQGVRRPERDVEH